MLGKRRRGPVLDGSFDSRSHLLSVGGHGDGRSAEKLAYVAAIGVPTNGNGDVQQEPW